MASTHWRKDPAAIGTLLGVACLLASSAGILPVAASLLPSPPVSAGPDLTPAAVPLPAPSDPPALATSGTPSSAPGCNNVAAISSWSLSRRAAQLVTVPAEETDVAAVGPAVEAGAGGIVLFGSAAPTDLGAQMRALETADGAGPAPLVMTDEEGGGVQRMSNLVGSLPWPATMSATMTPAAVLQLAEGMARGMAAAGVTVDLAPVLDLASGPGPDATRIDGPRSFGPDPQIATTYGLAFAEGLEAGGVIPVIKHFPGEGGATANTDDAPASTPPLATLEAADLLPFEAAISARLPAVMVGDASVPGLTQGPASLSPAVITGLLRNQLGFEGLVLTDALSAPAISDLGIGVPDASVEAVAAGADMVLYNSTTPNVTFRQVVGALTTAVSDGQVPVMTLNTAVMQVLAAKGVNLCA
jgi:beta-N-acetylhexosaminidase